MGAKPTTNISIVEASSSEGKTLCRSHPNEVEDIFPSLVFPYPIPGVMLHTKTRVTKKKKVLQLGRALT